MPLCCRQNSAVASTLTFQRVICSTDAVGLLCLLLAQVFPVLEQVQSRHPALAPLIRDPDVHMTIVVIYEILFAAHPKFATRKANHGWHALWHRALAATCPPFGSAVFASPKELQTLPAHPAQTHAKATKARCEEAFTALVPVLESECARRPGKRGLFDRTIVTMDRWKWAWAVQARCGVEVQAELAPADAAALRARLEPGRAGDTAAIPAREAGPTASSGTGSGKAASVASAGPSRAEDGRPGLLRGRMLVAPLVWAVPPASCVPDACPCVLRMNDAAGTIELVLREACRAGQPLALDQASPSRSAHSAVVDVGVVPPVAAVHHAAFRLLRTASMLPALSLSEAGQRAVAKAAAVPWEHWPPEAIELRSDRSIEKHFMGVARAVVCDVADAEACAAGHLLFLRPVSRPNEARALRLLAASAQAEARAIAALAPPPPARMMPAPAIAASGMQAGEPTASGAHVSGPSAAAAAADVVGVAGTAPPVATTTATGAQLDSEDATVLLARAQLWGTTRALIARAAAKAAPGKGGAAVATCTPSAAPPAPPAPATPGFWASVPPELGERRMRAAAGRGLLLRRLGYTEARSGAKMMLVQFAAAALSAADAIERAEAGVGAEASGAAAVPAAASPASDVAWEARRRGYEAAIAEKRARALTQARELLSRSQPEEAKAAPAEPAALAPAVVEARQGATGPKPSGAAPASARGGGMLARAAATAALATDRESVQPAE